MLQLRLQMVTGVVVFRELDRSFADLDRE